MADERTVIDVRITEVQIPMTSLVALLFRIAVAAIPAMLFLCMIVGLVALLLVGYGGLLRG